MEQAVNLSRRRFFRAQTGNSHAIRPPWSVAEQTFFSLCQRCDDCVKACETGLLKRGDGGYPEADFNRGECTFCQQCVEACQHEALLYSPDSQPWRIKAAIKDSCLARNGIHCRTCAERCDLEAITFRLMPGGIAQPTLDTEACTGCGACVADCPSRSITMNNEQQTHDSGTQNHGSC
ncbi:ferredoxin-type protein NapF [Parendozoicomonas haliclonae]|uniref:Ferredoxin-type protein NapF n=1 Tax=Parendozoicomonas haliclonae TaxID=1960125 RepID=A0A1X7AFA2_9GAMM|nr:ferredoxin-type protein NapF [Parendozoicomonas haliclonae]SMA35134.1 ferredoxin-type protein [Parendozoicomonas haliclonae]